MVVRGHLEEGGLFDASVEGLADAGILVTPGTFYGDAGARHVRIALTASDDTIAAAADRLAQLSNR